MQTQSQTGTSKSKQRQIQIEWPGYDRVRLRLSDEGILEAYHLEVSRFSLKIFKQALQKAGEKLALWEPSMVDTLIKEEVKKGHEEALVVQRTRLLFHELILKAQGAWNIPYQQEIVCDCRQVSGERINHALAAGAADLAAVSLWTTACTSCTTCKNKIDELIQWRKTT